MTTPVERRADDRAVEIRALERDLPLGHPHLFASRADARVERVDGRAGGVDLGGGRVADADELRQAREVDARLVEAHFAFVDVPARGFGLRLGQRHGRALRLIVQPREHLSFAHRHAFLDVHLHDLAGNFRRHRRPAARGDIAGGVQDGGLRSRLPRRDRGDFHLDGALAAEATTTRRRRRARRRTASTSHPIQRRLGRESGSRSSRSAARSSFRSVMGKSAIEAQLASYMLAQMPETACQPHSCST